MRFNTKTIHSGQKPDASTGAVTVPIYQTSTYRQEGINVHRGFEYSRTGNPTRQALEECLAAIEEGSFGLTFSSGLAAEHAILSCLRPGDHVVAIEDMYGGTYRLFEKVFKEFGLRFSYVRGSVHDFENAIRPETKLFWIETPTNPLMRISDIASVSALAHRQKIDVVVDNTFASPFFQRPLKLGADLVVHSTTKYIGGHSDLVGGAIVTSNEAWYGKLKFIQNSVGAIPGIMDCWLMLRGLKTLGIRMKKHEENACKVAEFLAKHPGVLEVYYPGLNSNRFHNLAKQQMSGFGGMVSFRLKDADLARVDRFLKELRIISLAESLGGVESLICYPASMTHGAIPGDQRIKTGITEDLVRLSVGIEDVEDLLEDLSVAFQKTYGY